MHSLTLLFSNLASSPAQSAHRQSPCQCSALLLLSSQIQAIDRSDCAAYVLKAFMQQGCLLLPLQRHPIAHGLLLRQDSSSRPQHCSWRSGISTGELGTACPQRHTLTHPQPRRGSRLVPETFLFDWVSTQTSKLKQAQQAAHQQPQQAAAQSRHHVDFSAAQAAIDETGSSCDGSTFGASAKQLLQTAVHSLENFEPRDTGSFEDEAIETFEEAGMHTNVSTAHIVKANYEVSQAVVSMLCCWWVQPAKF